MTRNVPAEIRRALETRAGIFNEVLQGRAAFVESLPPRVREVNASAVNRVRDSPEPRLGNVAVGDS
jgi:hypothetical protein